LEKRADRFCLEAKEVGRKEEEEAEERNGPYNVCTYE
jgi:hypothetical protein